MSAVMTGGFGGADADARVPAYRTYIGDADDDDIPPELPPAERKNSL